MAINERLIDTEVAAAGNGGAGTGNQEEGLILHLDANDVDSYDGDGSEWIDITNHEYTPATNVSEHFNTVLFSPTASGITSITGIGFQPDLVWTKNRDRNWYHQLYDSVRGGGKNLYPNDVYGENSPSLPTSHLDSLDSDGFTVDYSENIGDNHVAWCFKAGGAPSGSDKVSIDGTSYATMSAAGLTDGNRAINKLSVNTKLGFSIATIQNKVLNNGSNIAHGLGVPPELILAKKTDSSDNWIVFSKTEGGNRYLVLNSTSTSADDTYWGDANPSSTLINFNWTSAAQDYVFYSFASKRGVSKVGSYVGNGSTTTGNTIDVGFEASWIMIKKSSGTAGSSSGWFIIDNKRNTSDPWNKYLFANSNQEEKTTTASLTSVGATSFTVKSSGAAINQSGSDYIYYAVAKNTNETSLIPDTDLELHLDAASFPQKGESGYSNTPSTWTDSSGNSNNGTISGATFDSELGNYLDFDGSGDYVTVPTSGMLDGDFTIEMWWNFDTVDPPSGSAYRMLWGGSGYTGGTGLGHYIQDNKIDTWVSINGTVTNIGTTSGILSANKWYNIVITREGSTFKQYLDGNLINTATGVTTASLESANSTIGKHYNNSLHDVDGQVGQVRVYGSALTENQVRQNYNFTKPNYPNGFDGDINGATWNSAGYFNFDGSNDYISLNQGNNMSGGFFNNFSISYWVKLDTTSTQGRHFYAYSSSSNYIILYYNHSLGGMRLGGGNINTQQASYTMSANTWYHIVVTQSSENVSLYVNTSRKINSNQSIGTYNDMKVTLGAADQNGSISNSLDGKISKFKLYDKILTTTEIDTLYNEGE